MADVFLSYSSRHPELTRQLAAVIEAEGYSVWWDRDLESWGSYQRQIRAALDAARVVVVIWSEGACASDYVYAEARRAYEGGKLVNACAPDFPLRDIPEPMNVAHIDAVTDHAGILATIAAVWSGAPVRTRVPYHALLFGRFGRRLLDPKTAPLNRHAEEVNPSELLQARYEVVPFVDVAGRRQEMLDWCRLESRPTAGRVIHGPGGLGKTRLMIDVAAALRAEGWLAGFLEPPPESNAPSACLRDNALAQLIATGDEPGVLIVLDYAEGCHQESEGLVRQLDARPRDATRLARLVLLARSAGAWWQEAFDKSDVRARLFRRPLDPTLAIGEFKGARQQARYGDVVGLDPIPQGDVRVDFFQASVEAFRPVVLAMGWPPRGDAAPDPRRLAHYRAEKAFARPLALQMEALLHLAMAELDPDVIGVDAMLERILGLERAHWNKLLGQLDENREYALRRGVAGVTAVAGVGSRDALTGMLMRDRHYKREVPDHARQVLSDLTRIYGTGPGAVLPLEPDLIGEHEVAITADSLLVDACLDWIATLPADGRSTPRKQLVTVLQRATLPEHGERAENAVALLDHLVCHRTAEVAAELIAVTIATPGRLGDLLDARVDSLDDAALGLLDNALPAQSLALMDFSCRIAEQRLRLAPHAEVIADAEEPPEAATAAELGFTAARFETLAIRLSHLGRPEVALAASSKAFAIYRRLAKVRPDIFLVGLANSLTTLGMMLANLDRREAALDASGAAVEIYRGLAQDSPDVYLPNLATGLNNLGKDFANLGRRDEALAAGQEAVDILRRIVPTGPDALAADLASSLSNLGVMLSDLGRFGEALAASQEAVETYRRLAATMPDAFEPDLASSLTTLGAMFFNLRRGEEALAACRESVDIRRRLAAIRPDAFLLGFARSLNNLATALSSLEHREQALAASREAVDIFRRLAISKPDLLATSLGVLGRALSRAKHHPDAVAAAGEAMAVMAPLARKYPQAHGREALQLAGVYLEICKAAGVAPDVALLEGLVRVPGIEQSTDQ